MPLSDRDYMRSAQPSRRPPRRTRGFNPDFGLNPLWVLIIINFVFFIATSVSGNARFPLGDAGYIIIDRFTYYLGLIPYYFTSRPWTIFTAMFIHFSFWHLFGNLIVLFFFGRFLQRLVGDNKFLLVYLVGGIFGNIVFLLWGLFLNPLSIAVGASGAVYAVAGALVVLAPKARVMLYFLIPMPLWVFVLVFLVLFSFIFGSPNIAWQAHLGGFLVGLVAGYFFRRSRRFYFY